jgi:hypothetical protein
MFTGVFIDSKRILETLKIVGLNPCCTRIHKTLKPKISKIRLRLEWASRRGALDCTMIDLLLLHTNIGVFDPCLRRLSAGALDRSHRLQLLLPQLLAFPNSCPLIPRLPECFLFFQRHIKQRKHKKKVK